VYPKGDLRWKSTFSLGRGMMGHRGMSPVMMRIIFALMDSDDDGTREQKTT